MSYYIYSELFPGTLITTLEFVCWLLLMGEGALLCIGMYVSVLPLFVGIYVSVHLGTHAYICRFIKFGYNLSNDIKLEAKYYENSEACDLSDLMVVENVVWGYKTIVALFWETKFCIDIDVCVVELSLNFRKRLIILVTKYLDRN